MAPKAKNAQPAPATQPTAQPAAFTPSEADISVMREIDTATNSGSFRFVSSAEAGHLVANGLAIVNTSMLDANGNAAAQLTDNGKKALPPMTTNTEATASNAAAANNAAPVSFAIANVVPPKINRTPPKGGGQKPKYPQLDSLEIGQAMFIPATAPAAGVSADDHIKKLSKQFGSMMADRNAKNKDKYFTSRSLPDGKAAGFQGVNADGTPNPDAYAGVAGTGLYRRPLDERKTRAPRKSKGEANAPAGSGTATGEVGTVAGTPAGTEPAGTAAE